MGSLTGLFRQAWRRLVSMRTALVLLFFLALAAVPGSLLPQRPLNPSKVQTYLDTHGAWGRFLDAIGAFDVFGSFWFAAVYLLLFVSLIGCLIPRIRVYAKALRSKPLKAPRNLSRLAENGEFSSPLAPDDAAVRARDQLRPRWRTAIRQEEASAGRPAAVTVSAEKGYSREAGNLIFHVSLLVALVLIALGRFYSYEGSSVITEGQGLCNPAGPYDSYRAGSWVNPGTARAFCIDNLDKFTATYRDDGSPAQFKADVTYSEGSNGSPRHDSITVNHPLRLEGDRVYLINHGFAPTVTVTRPGEKSVTDTEVFLPQDGNLTSEGVFKFGGKQGTNDDIGLEGLFAPTPQDDGNGVITSIAPQPKNPVLAVFAWVGDDQLDQGLTQSVYTLDKTKMSKVAAKNLSVGQSLKLPNGTTIRFDGYKQWVTLQVSHDPAQGYLLGAAVSMVLGLLGSLVVRRRRVWLRIRPVSGEGGSAQAGLARSLVEVGGLARSDSGNFSTEFEALIVGLRTALNADVADSRVPVVGVGAGKD
jgi:cytochrome c biogenesis protein